LDIDFGYRASTPRSVSGKLWEDTNKNGNIDVGESKLAGVTIDLLQWNTVIASTSTAADGSYSFSGIASSATSGPGTVAVTNGSVTVVGIGTTFKNNLVAGEPITIAGGGYTIQSVTDNTHLTLTTNYAGTTASGLAYSAISYTVKITDTAEVLAGYTGTWEKTELLISPFNGQETVNLSSGDITGVNFGYFNPIPTLVVLSYFSAYDKDGQVVVRWETATEIDTLGFNLFRLDPATGEYIQVNSGLLPGMLSPHRSGIYTFIDRGALSGNTYTYKLIEVELNGRQLSYGPFTVLVRKNIIDEGSGLSLSSNGNTKKSSFNYDSKKSAFEYNRKEKDESEFQRDLMKLRKVARESSQLMTSQAAVTGDRLKISVTDAGIYYVDAKDISSKLVIDLNAVSLMIGRGRLSLSNQGKQVAYLPAKNNAGFFFYGTGTDSIYTKENVYWIDKGEGTMMTVVRGKGPTPSPSSGERSFTETVHFEENLIPWDSLFNDPDVDYWFWDQIFVPDYDSYPPKDSKDKNFTFEVPGLATTQTTATIRVNLFGGSNMGIPNDHHVVINLNGQQIGEDSWWSGQTPYTFTATSSINAGENTITVKELLDPGVSSSFILIDSFDVTYQRIYEANGDELFFRGDGLQQPVTVEGFTSSGIMVFDITNPLMPILNTATIISATSPPDPISYTVSLNPATLQTPYLAVAGEGAITASVTAVKSSNLSDRRNIADYLIIAPDPLVETAKLLADYRYYSQGLKTMVVKLEDIMNEFNYGISSPEAIKKFLSIAYSRWKKSPRYVVLAGDGSMDYKDNLGFGGNLIPSKMVSTDYGLAMSDNYLADVNGDHLPEIAIGRLPVVNPVELQTVISKIKTYERNRGNNRVILLADTPDNGGDFIADSEALTGLFPSGYAINRIYLDDPTMIEERKIALIDAINGGAAFFNYAGHAGPDQLSYSGVLSYYPYPEYNPPTDDLPSLTNANILPVMTAMTCGLANFSDPYQDVLGEALLLKPDGGMAATWSATGLSDNAQAGILNREFYKAVLSGKKAVLGDAVLNALSVYKNQGTMPFMMDIYCILGDPALRMR
jgi:hypothetical protein